MTNENNVQYYLDLPYNINVQKINDESGSYYYARVTELDGCHSHADTPEQAYANVREVLRDHIEIKLEYGDPIPEPVTTELSGKFNVRIPKSLHKYLTERAEAEGVSLNQYVLYKLSR